MSNRLVLIQLYYKFYASIDFYVNFSINEDIINWFCPNTNLKEDVHKVHAWEVSPCIFCESFIRKSVKSLYFPMPMLMI